MTYSKLSSYNKQPLEHFYNGRDHVIDTITIHCTAGNIKSTAKSLVDYFFGLDRKASCNYVVGGDGSIGGVVAEENGSWCSSNKANDMRAITIEMASEHKPPYRVSDEALNALYELLTDICFRYGITLTWSTNKEDRVNHKVSMTAHRDFAAKSCPGDYLYNLEQSIADIVNARVSKMKQSTSESEVENNMATTVNETASQLTKLAGKSVIGEIIMRDEIFAQKYPAYKDIVQYYYQAEEAYDIRADLAICQSLLETGHFTFKGYVKPEWNNFAGLGATDKNANKNIAIFANPFLGVVAQMQHLYAYVFTDDPTKKYPGWVIVDPRFNLVKRGSAPYVEILGQQENKKLGFGGYGWASGKDYGYKIMKIYNDLLTEYDIKEESEPVHIDIPDWLKTGYTENVEDLTEQRDVPDYIVQVNPTKVNVYAEANLGSKVLYTKDRGRYKIIEEKDGFGLLEDKSGWLHLAFCTYIQDAE